MLRRWRRRLRLRGERAATAAWRQVREARHRLLGTSVDDLHEVAADVWDGEALRETTRRDMSHWRGEGRFADDDHWLNIGKTTLRTLDRLEKHIERPWRKGGEATALEWGPGGGSNQLALAPHVARLVAVDISNKNLDECRRILTTSGQSEKFVPVLLEGSLADVASRLPSVDVVVSTAVFQHFPSKKYGAEVLRVMVGAMTSGAVGMIQIRFENGNAQFAPKTPVAYREHYRTATSYRFDEFWDLLLAAGATPIAIMDVKTRNNYATYLFEKPADG